MSSTTLYDSTVELGPLTFTGSVTCSKGKLFEGFSTPPHAAVVLGRQKGSDHEGLDPGVGCR
jgi:hypothetical protein